MTIIFGLLSAFSYGYADFVGALAAKRIRAVAATTYSFSVGLLIALVLSVFVGADYSAQTIQAGIYAGICSAIAISCLYAALALGPISIVSPLTAVVSAVIPVIFDVVAGQELSSFAVVAVILILIAVVLVGFVPGDKVLCLGAGYGYAAAVLAEMGAWKAVSLVIFGSDSGVGR